MEGPFKYSKKGVFKMASHLFSIRIGLTIGIQEWDTGQQRLISQHIWLPDGVHSWGREGGGRVWPESSKCRAKQQNGEETSRFWTKPWALEVACHGSQDFIPGATTSWGSEAVTWRAEHRGRAHRGSVHTARLEAERWVEASRVARAQDNESTPITVLCTRRGFKYNTNSINLCLK